MGNSQLEYNQVYSRFSRKKLHEILQWLISNSFAVGIELCAPAFDTIFADALRPYSTTASKPTKLEGFSTQSQAFRLLLLREPMLKIRGVSRLLNMIQVLRMQGSLANNGFGEFV
jgi:hypothetical protein